jgi:hypothetical protein
MANYEAQNYIVTNGLVLNLDAGDPDSYTRSQPPYVEVLVVAGGGGCGGHGGGGGAGGLIYNSAYQITNASAITVTVGGGGAGTGGPANGANGSNSVFGSLTAIGGGGGAYANPGSDGGSGGGGGFGGSAGGLGTAGQGNNGGKGDGSTNLPGGGGGGAGQVGGNNVGTTSGKGGDGLAFSISGTSTYYAGGGGGGGFPNNDPGAGGLGGGGTAYGNGTANTGGGGGAGAGSGGSGIIIVRYPGLPAATGGTITYLNGYTIHTFTSSGTFTPYPWNDLSGNNNSGSLINGVGFNSYQNGGSLTFDGTDDVVDVVSNFGTYANYTICYWAVRDADNRMPVAGRLNTNFYWFGDNSWAYTHGGVWGEYYYAKNVSIPLGSWGHLCVVYNGSNVSIYRQGIYQGQQSTTGTADWSQGLKIGYWAGGTGYAWLGKIPVVQFYNRALSAAEITQNFNAQRNRFGV